MSLILFIIGISLVLDNYPWRGIALLYAAVCVLGHDEPKVQAPPAPVHQEQPAPPRAAPPQSGAVPQPPKRWTI